MTILGTRPEIIRLSRIIPVLDRHCTHVIVNTGQNHDPALNANFFSELELRKPDHELLVEAPTFRQQLAQILERAGDVMERERPDRVLLLGDTNSALCAIVAARMGIPVYHLEAGNRCYDDRVPEEINRRLIDHCSTVLMPYTERSAQNLVREGIERRRVFVVGNPIGEVWDHYLRRYSPDELWAEEKAGAKAGHYMVATIHRAENVDDPGRLEEIVIGLRDVAAAWKIPIIVSTHPRTRERLSRLGIPTDYQGIRWLEPMGFIDFARLIRNAFRVITDSGTVQEECCIAGVPSVTVRTTTERPETVECGSNIVCGTDPESMLRAVSLARESPGRDEMPWSLPAGYAALNVSATVAKIVLGHLA